jgi:hypothetical protein
MQGLFRDFDRTLTQTCTRRVEHEADRAACRAAITTLVGANVRSYSVSGAIAYHTHDSCTADLDGRMDVVMHQPACCGSGARLGHKPMIATIDDLISSIFCLWFNQPVLFTISAIPFIVDGTILK